MNANHRFDDFDQRLAALLVVSEANANQINQLAGNISALTKSVGEMRSLFNNQIAGIVNETAERFAGFVLKAEVDRAVMQQMQSEVRDLQTENHRILDCLQYQQRGDSS